MNRHLIEAHQLLLGGHFEEAAELCRKAIRLQRDAATARRMLADCHYNLGVTKLERGAPGEAVAAEFRRALDLDPSHADAANNLGAFLLTSRRPEEAVGYLRAAVKLRPRDRRGIANLTRALVQAGELEEASRLLLTLAQVAPDNAGAYLACEALLVEPITPAEEYVDRVRARILGKLDNLATTQAAIGDPLEFAATYFPLSYHGRSNVEIVKRLAALYLRWCPSLAWQSPHVARWRGPGRRIRIGLASRFFRNHSISNTTRGLFEKLDRERFEVIAIRLEPSNGDELARLIDGAADRVVTVSLPLEAAREAIASLELDVLFFQDVGLEPISYFLAFARLAPVQLTSFGHPDTTGIPNLDYFLSSSLYERPDAQDDYSERLVEIPGAGTLAYYHRPAVPSTEVARSELAVDPQDHVYFCPQTLLKVQPAMDAAFEAIVNTDRNARIVLIEFHAAHRRAMEKRFSRRPRLAERARFVPVVDYSTFLARMRQADVILDTFHFNGQNTTLEAFAMGVPVVTMRGALQRARHGLGLYSAMGFTELVANDTDDYVRKAVAVANDGAFRKRCVRAISDSCGVLFESGDFIARCQQALETMVQERQRA